MKFKLFKSFGKGKPAATGHNLDQPLKTQASGSSTFGGSGGSLDLDDSGQLVEREAARTFPNGAEQARDVTPLQQQAALRPQGSRSTFGRQHEPDWKQAWLQQQQDLALQQQQEGLALQPLKEDPAEQYHQTGWRGKLSRHQQRLHQEQPAGQGTSSSAQPQAAAAASASAAQQGQALTDSTFTLQDLVRSEIVQTLTFNAPTAVSR